MIPLSGNSNYVSLSL